MAIQLSPQKSFSVNIIFFCSDGQCGRWGWMVSVKIYTAQLILIGSDVIADKKAYWWMPTKEVVVFGPVGDV